MAEPVNILLVDDEPRNLDVLESILGDPGYRLLRASDADGALYLLLQHDVAAIVLDIQMPGVSGFELARMIKGTKKYRQVPIVFLTAHLLEDRDILSGYDAGAVDYLTKPILPPILRQKVAVYAELFRKNQALAEMNTELERRVHERTAELERSEAALRDANRQKDLFLARLAHELRNPLAPLRTGLHLLLAREDRPAAMDRTLAAMDRQVDHMVRLIDDLLDVSRITRGRMEIRKEPAELCAVVDRAVEMTATHFSQRDQRLDWQPPGEIPVLVDATRIAQIVANLLSNASKYSPRGSSISLRVEGAGERALVEVIDRGIGIPAGELPRIFEMFARVERSEALAPEGLGVGLALSLQLAQLHGGSLVAESEGEGRGTTLRLSIPKGRVERPADRAANGRADAGAPASGPARLRVVLVDDNEDSATVMCLWLEQLGHEVRVAHTGPDGLALIKETRPDLALCDIGLPGLDGVEVCRRVLQEMPRPPVMVALSGWGAPADRARTLEAGFRDHLVKPVDMFALCQVLETVHSAPPSATEAVQTDSSPERARRA
ncbi:MAG: response regulator [Myxococcales bacterium]|nr:response regulator [Myxococcales bacterium]